jgi:hypothetical protein
MVKRTLRWTTISLLVLFLMGFAAYPAVSRVQVREFDSTWYHMHLDVTEAEARAFCAQHRAAVVRAQADHFFHPIGPGRIIALLGASSRNDSGEVFLFFGSQFVSSSAALHLLPVYCWSEREKRLLWKGLQNNSP